MEQCGNIGVTADLFVDDNTKQEVENYRQKVVDGLLNQGKILQKGIDFIKENKCDFATLEKVDEIEDKSLTSLFIYQILQNDGEFDVYSSFEKIVEYINKQFSDTFEYEGQIIEGWRWFPRICLKAISSNTMIFTRLMELSQTYISISDNNDLNIQK